MGHRHLPHSFHSYQIRQHHHQNYVTPAQPYMGSTIAVENAATLNGTENLMRSEIDFPNYSNAGNRMNIYPQLNTSMELPYFQPAGSAPPYDYPSSSAAGVSFHPLTENRVGPQYTSYYHGHGVNEVGNGLPDPAESMGRGAFKRKTAGIPAAFEGGSTNRYFLEGTSSGSGLPPENLFQDYQNIPSIPTGFPQFRSSSLFLAADESRNVRSRSELNMAPPPMGNHYDFPSPSYPSTNFTVPNSRMVYQTNINANVTAQEWSCNAGPSHLPGRNSTSDISAINGTNQFPLEVRAAEVGQHSCERVQNDGTNPTPQYFPVPPLNFARGGHINHNQRIVPLHRDAPSFPDFHYEAASCHNGLQLLAETRGSHRSSCPRSSYVGERHRFRNEPMIGGRLTSFMTAMDIDNRMGIEASMVVDRFHSSREMYDLYGDMRLDVDNMSYEELLALGERIGTVSTGLSEAAMSESLAKITYNPAAQNEVAGSCAICLEEFVCMEEVGRLKNCKHDYHLSCIKRWLSMKNLCPICKGPAAASG